MCTGKGGTHLDKSHANEYLKVDEVYTSAHFEEPEAQEVINYLEEEVTLIKSNFNLDSVLAFQANHDIQITRGADYQYICYIDGKGYASALTPIGALVNAMRIFNTGH